MAIDIENPGADEAELKAAIQALANEIVVVTLSANTTLDSTYYSKLVEVDTSAVVITFPTAPATEQTIDVINTSAGSITVNGLTVAAGKTVGHISIDSAWVEITPNVSAGSSYTDEQARDAIAAALVASDGVNIVVNDGADTITFSDFRTKPYISGTWYKPANYEDVPVGAGNASAGSTTMYFAPILFRDGLTIDSIAARIETISAAGNFQLHLYAADPTTLLPTGAPLWSSTNQSTGTATTVTIGSLSIAVTPGWYWLGVMVDNSTAIFAVAGQSTSVQLSLAAALIGSDTAANALAATSPTRQFTKTGVTYGTPPTMTGNRTTDGISFNATGLRVPAIAFKGA